MIRCNIQKASIGHHTVLHEIEFSASNGKILCLLGKNGSGKTSLLRCLSGLLHYQGDIQLEQTSGKLKRGHSPNFSYMPQSCSPLKLTVEQLLSFTRCPNQSLFQTISPEEEDDIRNILEQLDLQQSRDKLLCHLSGGERQLAYFASQLVQDRQHLFLDEPCASLDPERKDILFRMLKEERGRGKCILLSLHQLEDAFRIADEMILLAAGRIAFMGSPDQLLSSGLIQQEFSLVPCVVAESGHQYVLFHHK